MPVRVKRGNLFFDLYWRGVRCKEYTGLADTPENRRRCVHTMQAVDRAIARGTFDYRQHFPRGSRLHVFFPEDRAHEGAATTFADYIARWHKRRSPFLPDGSVGTDAELHPSTWIHDESIIRRLFIPAFVQLRLDDIDVARCREFRRAIVDAGLFEPVGERRGRYYLARSELRAEYERVRADRAPKATADPFVLADGQLQLSLDASTVAD